MPVQATPNMKTDPQACAPGMASGKAKSAGTVKARLAPNWLPVADTKAGRFGMYFLLKLPAMA
jgi:hypothetical protein